jgi:hypothetical protein
VPEGAFEGILHVTVHRIEGFSDTVGQVGVGRRFVFFCARYLFSMQECFCSWLGGGMQCFVG